jgi:glycosyltransferase involved in cell wall biosynthesis
MITFLNFAPYSFGGGAERWMIDVGTTISKIEEVTLVDVSRNISNIYANIVLKRKFDPRLVVGESKTLRHISITFTSLIPFSQQWKKNKFILKNSRLVYIKYELLETLIVIYFGGFSCLKKTVAGIHSPFIYSLPTGFLDYLHNFIYTSILSRKVLSCVYKVHVLNNTDKKLFSEKFQLRNIIHVPNYAVIDGDMKWGKNESNYKGLNIAFIGELSIRKGVDILIKTIKKSPDNYVFHIAGDGPMRNEIIRLNTLKRVKYHGYLSDNELSKLYSSSDIIFIPSKAESFSLVCLEAMTHGLPIISSSKTHIELPKFAQNINFTDTPEGYLRLFKDMLEKKENGLLAIQKKKVHDYVGKTFSREIIIRRLLKQIFEIKSV